MMIRRLSSAKSTHTVEIYEPADWQKATTIDDDGDDDDDDDGDDDYEDGDDDDDADLAGLQEADRLDRFEDEHSSTQSHGRPLSSI